MLEAAEGLIGYQFKDHELLQRCLTHASLTEDRLMSNERLEFLGDAVLGMVVCDYLFEQFPDLLEGEMTKVKSMVAKIEAELLTAFNPHRGSTDPRACESALARGNFWGPFIE